MDPRYNAKHPKWKGSGTVITKTSAMFWLAVSFLFVIPHDMNPMVVVQSHLQEALNPAQWVPYVRDLHRHEMDIGVFPLSQFGDVVSDIYAAMESSGLSPQPRST